MDRCVRAKFERLRGNGEIKYLKQIHLNNQLSVINIDECVLSLNVMVPSVVSTVSSQILFSQNVV